MNQALAQLVPMALQCGQTVLFNNREPKGMREWRPAKQLPKRSLEELIAELPPKFQNSDVQDAFAVSDPIAYKFIKDCLKAELIVKCNRCLYMSAELAKIDPIKRKYLGVSLVKGGKFQATIKTNGKTEYLGNFELAINAAKAYDVRAKQLNRKTNFLR